MAKPSVSSERKHQGTLKDPLEIAHAVQAQPIGTVKGFYGEDGAELIVHRCEVRKRIGTTLREFVLEGYVPGLGDVTWIELYHVVRTKLHPGGVRIKSPSDELPDLTLYLERQPAA